MSQADQLDPASVEFIEGILRGDKEDAPPLGNTVEAEKILDKLAPVDGEEGTKEGTQDEVGGRRRTRRRRRRMKGGCGCGKLFGGAGTKQMGGARRRRGSVTRKRRSSGRRRAMRGGSTCFGNGVGATSYDPNFSIYNTRELQLFPYKP